MQYGIICECIIIVCPVYVCIIIVLCKCAQVAGLVGRAELLSALFFIGSFLAYRRAALKSGSNGEIVCVCRCM